MSSCISKCCSCLWSDNAQKIYKATLVLGTVIVVTPLVLYYEYTDASLVNKVTKLFAQCVANNSTDAVCCLSDWSQVSHPGT